MRFNSKQVVLICFFILLMLTGIQSYLLYNMYRLDQGNYQNSVTAQVLKLASNGTFQTLDSSQLGSLMKNAEMVEKGEMEIQKIRRQIILSGLAIARKYDDRLAFHAKTDGRLRGVRLLTTYTSVIISFGNRKTIAADQAHPLRMYVVRDPEARIIALGDYNGKIDKTGSGASLTISYRLSKRLEMPEFPVEILRRSVFVGLLSLILFICAVSVFYLVIKSGDQQRKVAEVRRDLVDNIAHELKTPLSAMAIAFKTWKLLDAGNTPAGQVQLFNTLERQHQRLTKTVDRILDSALKAYRLPDEASVEMKAFLKAYGDQLILENHSLSLSIAESVCRVRGTAELIGSAIDNLISNAQKYTSGGLAIHLSGKIEDGRYRIDVRDNGAGIKEEFRGHLFEKFYRVPGTGLHSVRGMGLGLYLSRASIRSAGGEVLLSSSSNKGSVFTIYLNIL